VPLVFASPHSGRAYPASFVAAARLDPVALRRSEDGFVDELFDAAAESRRCWRPPSRACFCDVNREPWELDPGMFDEPLPSWVNTASPRVAAPASAPSPWVVATGETCVPAQAHFLRERERIRRFWQHLPRGAGGAHRRNP
jgi:N-formylglutamate deformylase